MSAPVGNAMRTGPRWGQVETEPEGDDPKPRFSWLVRFAAFAYIALVPFEIDLVYAGRSYSFWAAAILVTLVALSLIASPRARRGGVNVRLVAVAVVLLWYALASSFWSIDAEATLAGWSVLFSSVVTWFCLALVASTMMGWALRALMLGASVMSVVTISADINYDGRAETLANSNDVAVVLILSMAAMIAGITRRTTRPLWRLVMVGLLVLHVSAVFATGSRTAVLALGMAVGLYLLRSLVTIRLGAVIGFVVLIGLTVLAVQWFGIDIPDRVLNTGQALETSDLSIRETIWAAALKELPSILGFGFATTSTYMGQTIGIEIVMHSVYLGIAFELGLFGFLIAAYFVIQLARGARGSVFGRELFLMAMSTAVMASTLTLETRRPLWLMLAFVAAASIGKASPAPARGAQQ